MLFERVFSPSMNLVYPINFFVKGSLYKLFGFIKTDVHLFGVPEGGMILLMGTDELGRDGTQFPGPGPAVFVILVALGFNFMGDGLRGAADLYK